MLISLRDSALISKGNIMKKKETQEPPKKRGRKPKAAQVEEIKEEAKPTMVSPQERRQILEIVQIKDDKGNVTKLVLLMDPKTRLYKTEFYFNDFPLKSATYIGKNNAYNFWELLKGTIHE